MGSDLEAEGWVQSIPFPQLLPQYPNPCPTPHHAQRGRGALQQARHVPTSKGREQLNWMKDQSPIPPAPDPCPGKKLKIYLPWEKAGDPPTASPSFLWKQGMEPASPTQPLGSAQPLPGSTKACVPSDQQTP